MKRMPRANVRRGAIAVLCAILLIPLFGLLAFAIDVGWMYLTKAELSNAADSAALAGASQLGTGYVQYNLPTQSGQATIVLSAKTTAAYYAELFAAANSAGGVSSLALISSDVEYGFTDGHGNYTSPYAGYPNTVKVTMRRDTSANGPLNLFFANIFGMSQTPVTATAAAVITGGTISTFNSGLGLNSLLLPVTFDSDEWNQFLATGQSADGNVHTGPNGAPQLLVYPSPGNAPGNFGLVCPGPPSSAQGSFASWITNGPSPNDLAYLQNNGDLSPTWTSPDSWAGGPGLKSSLVTAFAGIIGQQRLLPIFKPVSSSPYQAAGGQGSNSYYEIVGFVGVVVTEASGSGSNLTIAMQPAAVSDPTAIYDYSTVAPLGTNSSVTTTIAPPRLSQ